MEGQSTYTPLLRRLFVDERAREFREVEQLYIWVKSHQDAFTETKESIGSRCYAYFRDLPEPLADAIIYAMYDLISAERQIWELPPPDFGRMSMTEFVEYRNLLLAKQYFFVNQTEIIELLYEGVSSVLYEAVYQLPRSERPSPFTIPLINAIPDASETVAYMYGRLALDEFSERGLFRAVTQRMYYNICAVSGIDPNDRNPRKNLKTPAEARLALSEVPDAYFAGTPFRDLFAAPVPLKLTHEDRFSHMHILGGTNAGKTTLIESLVVHDIQSEDPPSIVLIDPHSDLVRRLIHADLGIKDRLIVIDPRDIKHPPAPNIFAINKDRFSSYDEATQEQVTAGVIQTFNYLFSGLTNLTLTGKQDVFFRYVARLMLSMPDTMGRNATILDMMKLMHDPTQYEAAIAALPDVQREFFRRDFMSKTFEQTKEQIRYRLQAIIENPTMARLFTSTETKVDLFTELNRGAVILVDTAKDFLKENSSTFGRLFISLVLQAVLERAAIDEDDRKPTFLIVDEAASFFSSNIDDLLTEARKYKCGCVFAHQFLDQASGSLRASLAANTTIKFVSGVSANDARAMAPEMRTTADFILDQPRYHFAAHIRNVTPQAVTIPITPVAGHRQLSPAEFEELMARNRERVSIAPPVRGPEGHRSFVMREEAQSPRHPDEDISAEW